MVIRDTSSATTKKEITIYLDQEDIAKLRAGLLLAGGELEDAHYTIVPVD